MLLIVEASMKALPKRKGNTSVVILEAHLTGASMKALPKRKGNPPLAGVTSVLETPASMKALPKRKGNPNLMTGR